MENIYLQKLEETRKVLAEIREKIGFISLEVPVSDVEKSTGSALETQIEYVLNEARYIRDSIYVGGLAKSSGPYVDSLVKRPY